MQATTTRISFLEPPRARRRADRRRRYGHDVPAHGPAARRRARGVGADAIPSASSRCTGASRAAGSDLVLTCTFGGTSLRLADGPARGRAAELNRRAAELAREAVGPDMLVAGSLGPDGSAVRAARHALATTRPPTPTPSRPRRSPRAAPTCSCSRRCSARSRRRAAIDGVRRASDLPFVLAFSFDRGTRTMMGTTTAEVVALAADSGAAAVGANCGTSLENMAAIVAELSAAAPGLPLWVKPNAGLPRMTGDSSGLRRHARAARRGRTRLRRRPARASSAAAAARRPSTCARSSRRSERR